MALKDDFSESPQAGNFSPPPLAPISSACVLSSLGVRKTGKDHSRYRSREEVWPGGPYEPFPPPFLVLQ